MYYPEGIFFWDRSSLPHCDKDFGRGAEESYKLETQETEGKMLTTIIRVIPVVS